MHKEFPKDVERWCSTTQEITRAAVSGLSAKLRGPRKQKIDSSKSEQGSEERILSSATTMPSLIVIFQDRSGTVDLHHAPQQPNHLIVHFTDGKQEEVPARQCQIDQIIFQ